MLSSKRAAELPIRRGLPRLRATWSSNREPRQAWHVRALREATVVRRAMRGARSATNGVVGLAATVDALSRGVVSEVLVTRRFAERSPVAAANMGFLAAISGARKTTVTGTAELELDLAAGGVAALLRRAAATV